MQQLAAYRPAVASQVYAANGELIGEFFLEKRYLVPLDKIPLLVRQAFVAAEDSNFYLHHGIDLSGIVRAFLNNVFAGEVVQGGSTITQQVVKSLLLSPERSYERKLKEVLLSLRLERQFTKDEILYIYLNQIYLGSGAYGVAAAAQVYFNKDVQELTLPEAALLAGLPQAPSRTSPIHHAKRARARELYVLERMEAAGYILPRATRDRCPHPGPCRRRAAPPNVSSRTRLRGVHPAPARRSVRKSCTLRARTTHRHGARPRHAADRREIRTRWPEGTRPPPGIPRTHATPLGGRSAALPRPTRARRSRRTAIPPGRRSKRW